MMTAENPTQKALGSALVVVGSILMGFRAGVSHLQPGVDTSYEFAINFAAVHGERWGTAFLSDRGPYGWLLYPVDVGDIARLWLAAQLFFVATVGIAAATYAWSMPGRTSKRVVVGLLLTYTVHLAFWEEWRYFSLFLLVFLIGAHREDRLGLVAGGIASFLGGFYLLMKLTIGPAALLTLAAGCLLQPSVSAVVTRLVATSGCAILGLLAGWLGHFGSTLGLARYLAVGWSMVAGYSQAASLAYDGWQGVVARFLSFFILLGAWAVFLGDRRVWKSLLLCSVPLFVAWKHSVVRQDVHGRVLVLFALFIVALLITDSLSAARRWRAAPLLAAAVGLLLMAWLHLPRIGDGSPAHTLRRALIQPLGLPGVGGLRALLDLPRYRATLADLSSTSLDPLVLSADQRSLIADSTVDVYPWESTYVAANHLKWAHRPSPASFSAFGPKIDAANAAFFESERRPQYLLWHRTEERLDTPGMTGVASIDGRHLFWDEPLTVVSILNHYQLANSGHVFLLAPRSDQRFVPRRYIETVRVAWGTWTPVPETSGVALAEIRIQRPLWAAVRALLLREEETFIDVRYRTQGTVRCRFIPQSGGSGLWISPLPRNTAQLQVILAGGLPERARVAEVCFRNGWGQANAPAVRLSWWTLDTRAVGQPSVEVGAVGRAGP